MTDVSFRLFSEKNAPTGQFFPSDGTISVNLDEIWQEAKAYKINRDGILISIILDVIGHEILHKYLAEEGGFELSNDQDERIFEITTDWVQLELVKQLTEYD